MHLLLSILPDLEESLITLDVINPNATILKNLPLGEIKICNVHTIITKEHDYMRICSSDEVVAKVGFLHGVVIILLN